MKLENEFLDKFFDILSEWNTSKLLILCVSQFRAIYKKARRNLKRYFDEKSQII